MADSAPSVILLAFANPYLRDCEPLERLIDEARDAGASLTVDEAVLLASAVAPRPAQGQGAGHRLRQQ